MGSYHYVKQWRFPLFHIRLCKAYKFITHRTLKYPLAGKILLLPQAAGLSTRCATVHTTAHGSPILMVPNAPGLLEEQGFNTNVKLKMSLELDGLPAEI